MSSNNTSERIDKERSKPSNYPSLSLHEEEIFIVVKTYPNPSKKYRETVCTAGITKGGEWIRLYPIDYRYMKFQNRYSKYQWIKVKIEKNTKDFRIDSYRPDASTIQPIGAPIETKGNWLDRKKIIMPTLKYASIEELKSKYQESSISLGIIKPKQIIEFKIENADEDWSTSHQQVLSQLLLFERQPKILSKIPFKFSYIFLCDDIKCTKPHKLSILDWELYALYLNLKSRYNYSVDQILEKMKNKWFDEICREDKDTHLIVGTEFPNPTFMVLGVFWPPK